MTISSSSPPRAAAERALTGQIRAMRGFPPGTTVGAAPATAGAAAGGVATAGTATGAGGNGRTIGFGIAGTPAVDGAGGMAGFGAFVSVSRSVGRVFGTTGPRKRVLMMSSCVHSLKSVGLKVAKRRKGSLTRWRRGSKPRTGRASLTASRRRSRTRASNCSGGGGFHPFGIAFGGAGRAGISLWTCLMAFSRTRLASRSSFVAGIGVVGDQGALSGRSGRSMRRRRSFARRR